MAQGVLPEKGECVSDCPFGWTLCLCVRVFPEGPRKFQKAVSAVWAPANGGDILLTEAYQGRGDSGMTNDQN
jgi:hypothetical protein